MKLYIVKCLYHDQFSSVDSVTGVYTSKKAARTEVDKGGGYLRMFKVVANEKFPDVLEEVK